jgi:CheY-like chemotaxis protein
MNPMPPAHPHAAADSGKWVLVAEDDAEMRRLVVTSLRRAGLQTREASDGAEALDVLRAAAQPGARAPAAIVTDLSMPRCSGRLVVAALHRYGSTIPVIVITAFGDAETHSAMKRFGVSAVFDKPFRLEELRSAVLRAVGGSA